jgi:predicted metal-dependent phosphotriesterase family hydrolase
LRKFLRSNIRAMTECFRVIEALEFGIDNPDLEAGMFKEYRQAQEFAELVRKPAEAQAPAQPRWNQPTDSTYGMR